MVRKTIIGVCEKKGWINRLSIMDKDKKLILYIVIAALLFLLWEAYRDTRHRNICEGMTEKECQAYQEVMGSR